MYLFTFLTWVCSKFVSSEGCLIYIPSWHACIHVHILHLQCFWGTPTEWCKICLPMHTPWHQPWSLFFFCSCQSLMCITVTCHTSHQWTKQSSLLDNIFICACMKSNLFYFRQFVFIGHFRALYMYVSLTWPQLHWVFTMHFMTT